MPDKRSSVSGRKTESRAGRYQLAVVFSALAICLAIVFCVFEFREVLFRDADPVPDTIPDAITTPLPPIPFRPETTADTTAEPLPFDTDPTPVTTPPVTTEPPETTNPPVTTEPPVTTKPPVTTEPPETTKPPVTTEPPVTTNPPETIAPPEPKPPAKHVALVPEGERVEDSYFSDALFIGDSRTVGLQLYSGLRSTYYSEQGLNVQTVQNRAYITVGDRRVTLPEALELNNSFKKVYISFGINEIGWPTAKGFMDSFTALVNLVEEKLPDAVICVQAVLPLSQKQAESERYAPLGGNSRVFEYNELLLALCEERGLYFINHYEIFADENGFLSASDSTDGIHLGVKSSRAWADYLRTHTVP